MFNLNMAMVVLAVCLTIALWGLREAYMTSKRIKRALRFLEEQKLVNNTKGTGA